MPRRAFSRITSAARLRGLLGLMLLGLALPSALLVRQGLARLELEEFRRQQLIAESVLARIDSALTGAIAAENARPVTDFLFVLPTDGGDGVPLSPLSSIAPAGAFPGTIGYFQVDAAGQVSTPLLPESEQELRDLEQDQAVAFKMQIARQVTEVLEANRLVENATADDASLRQLNEPASGASSGGALRGQLAFDRLAESTARRQSLSSLSESIGRSDAGVAPASAAAAEARAELQSVEEAKTAAGNEDEDATGTLTTIRVAKFAGEIEPLRFSVLETGHIVLFRNAWRDDQRYIQGLLVDRAELIRQSFAEPLAESGLAAGTALGISIAGEPVSVISASSANEAVVDASTDSGTVVGDTLYSARLSPPLSDIALEFTAGRLDRGPGFGLLVWTAVALGAVLIGGFTSMYLFGMQQLKLAREQRSFVSAVSHELKTPLTSIRMYGEMLKSGWADEAKKKAYYDFIVDEGERLSRLIENVLQLARLNNGGPAVEPVPITIGELFDQLRSKLASQAEREGFTLEIDIPAEIRALGIAVDADAVTQVFINLVDNAIKYSSDAECKAITLAARRQSASQALLSVRDYGPGIPPAALKRLFELFYRPDNELTRTTSGTGIGLALVRQLVTAMGGRIDVRNCEPGAEFRISFPLTPI